MRVQAEILVSVHQPHGNLPHRWLPPQRMLVDVEKECPRPSSLVEEASDLHEAAGRTVSADSVDLIRKTICRVRLDVDRDDYLRAGRRRRRAGGERAHDGEHDNKATAHGRTLSN